MSSTTRLAGTVGNETLMEIRRLIVAEIQRSRVLSYPTTRFNLSRIFEDDRLFEYFVNGNELVTTAADLNINEYQLPARLDHGVFRLPQPKLGLDENIPKDVYSVAERAEESYKSYRNGRVHVIDAAVKAIAAIRTVGVAAAENITQPTAPSKRPDGPLFRRSAFKTAIQNVLIANRHAKAIDICIALDEAGIDCKYPEVRGYEHAYDDPQYKSRIDTAISEVRAKMREHKLI